MQSSPRLRDPIPTDCLLGHNQIKTKSSPVLMDITGPSPSPNGFTHFPIVRKLRNPTSQAAGQGPILRISSDASLLLGVPSGELDKDFTFPLQMRRVSSKKNLNWPLKSNSILPELPQREQTPPADETVADNASDETVIRARRSTLARLEGKRSCWFSIVADVDTFRTSRRCGNVNM